MARITYRRRPDGILEIVRQKPWQRAGSPERAAVVALALVGVALSGVALWSLVGFPSVLLLAGCAALAWLLWRGQRKARAAPSRDRERRTAP